MRTFFLNALVLGSFVVACGGPSTAPPQPVKEAQSKTAGGASPPEHEAPRAPAPEPAPAEPPPAADANPAAPNVILITLDGVRWQDVLGERREELVPQTWALVRRSGTAFSYGSGCGVVRPRNTTHISLPGYLEIFTGRKTTCMSNVCANVAVPTVLDAAAAAGISTASIGSWEMLSAAASRGRTPAFVSAGTRWPGKRPLDDAKLEQAVAAGEKAKPFPAPEGTYRPDRFTTSIALEYFRARKPRLFHVGLGDTDEYGHRDNHPAYDTALKESDAFIGELGRLLDSLGLFERTTVIVTADHGRANMFRDHGPSYPESGRSFVLAFGGRVPKRGEACIPKEVWLTDIAPTIRAILGLPPDPSAEVVGKPIEEFITP
jgi:hypothetical protein